MSERKVDMGENPIDGDYEGHYSIEDTTQQAERKKEYAKSLRDSDTVFMVCSTCKTLKEAKEAIVRCYVPDMYFSRAGICHALKRLEKHFNVQTKN